ncbi:nose resistant to fluoxetine protein 6, partial [Caerostris darwini]
SSFIEELYSVLNNSTLTCKRTSREYTTSAVVVICLLSFFAVLAFIGSSITALEYWMNISPSTESVYGNSISERAMINGEAYSLSNKKSDDVLFINKANALPEWLEKCKPFFNCFCIFTNGEKILNTTSSEGQLPCLHGIRFLSMSWVILCHTYTMLPVSIRNKTVFADILNHWIFEVVLSGGFAVDSFFVLSGFLVAYLYFKQCSKNGGKIPWLYFYVHRYIRLTPVYMIVLAYFTTLYTYSNSGPLWPDYDVDANCKTGWWWNLLYISNFQSEKTHCMSWSWYLANDMQFYIISPLLLISLWRWPKIGYSLMGLIFAISFSAYFAITYKYDYDVTIESIAAKGSVNFQGMMDKFTDFTNKTYTKPYTRISPYLVGILLAYFLHRRKQNDSPKLNTITLSVGWIVASSITLACVFGLYNRQQTLIEACFYNSLSRTCFACGIAWVVFVCVADQGGIVNSILSWEVWIPLSRLTYCAYLVHPMVLQYAFLSIRKMFEYSLITM